MRGVVPTGKTQSITKVLHIVNLVSKCSHPALFALLDFHHVAPPVARSPASAQLFWLPRAQPVPPSRGGKVRFPIDSVNRDLQSSVRGEKMKRGAVLGLVLCLVLVCPGEAKKKRRQMPDLEKIGESFVGPSFGAELANMSRAVLKVGNWEVRREKGTKGRMGKGRMRYG